MQDVKTRESLGLEDEGYRKLYFSVSFSVNVKLWGKSVLILEKHF